MAVVVRWSYTEYLVMIGCISSFMCIRCDKPAGRIIGQISEPRLNLIYALDIMYEYVYSIECTSIRLRPIMIE